MLNKNTKINILFFFQWNQYLLNTYNVLDDVLELWNTDQNMFATTIVNWLEK